MTGLAEWVRATDRSSINVLLLGPDGIVFFSERTEGVVVFFIGCTFGNLFLKRKPMSI